MSDIRPARRNEAGLLTDLAVRSKAHWGYTPEFMKSAAPELAVSLKVLPQWWVWVAISGREIIGFASLRPEAADAVELVHLFVAPGTMGSGVGTRLWEYCRRQARRLGYRRLRLTADPNAESFYLRRGARRVGDVASPIVAGRVLPLMEAGV